MHNLFLYTYFYSLHVSFSYVLIIRRINCMNATPDIRMSLCVEDRLVCSPDLYTRRSFTQSYIYQVSH